jgi:hypothetical protein
MKHLSFRNIPENHKLFVVILIIFVLLASVYNLVLPIGEADHEVSHFRYIQYVKTHWHRPPANYLWPPVETQDQCEPLLPRDQPGMVEWQFSQPPLYYFLAASVFGWFQNDENWWPTANSYNLLRGLRPSGGINEFTHSRNELFSGRRTVFEVHLYRAFSTLIGMFGLLGSYLIGRKIFSDSKRAALLSAGVGFVPMYIFSSAIISNDILMGVLLIWSIFFFLQSILHSVRLKNQLANFLLGVLFTILASATKNSFIAILPVMIIASSGLIVNTTKKFEITKRQMVIALALLGAATLGLWLVVTTNIQHVYYDRYSFLSRGVLTLLTRPLAGSFSEIFFNSLTSMIFTFQAYWGLLGADAIMLPHWMQAILAIASLTSFAGLIYALIKKKYTRRLRILAIMSLFVVFVDWYGFYSILEYGIRGRYIIGLYPMISFLFILGTGVFAHKKYPLIGNFVFCGLTLFFALITPFLVIQKSFAFPKIYVAPPHTAGEMPVDATFDNLAELLGIHIHPQDVKPGDRIFVTLTWRVLESTANNYVVSVVLEDGSHHFVAGSDNFPGNGLYATSLWQTGDVFQDKYWFDIPQQMKTQLPSAGYIQIVMFCPATQEQVPIYDPRGNILDAVYSKPIRIGYPVEGKMPDLSKIMATFGDVIGLMNVENIPSTLDRKQQISLNMQWVALAHPKQNYSIYVQLLNEKNQVIAGSDYLLTQGYYPSSLWLPGETVQHIHSIELPSLVSLPPGKYRLVTGLYLLSTGERLPVKVNPSLRVSNEVVLAEWENTK